MSLFANFQKLLNLVTWAKLGSIASPWSQFWSDLNHFCCAVIGLPSTVISFKDFFEWWYPFKRSLQKLYSDISLCSVEMLEMNFPWMMYTSLQGRIQRSGHSGLPPPPLWSPLPPPFGSDWIINVKICSKNWFSTFIFQKKNLRLASLAGTFSEFQPNSRNCQQFWG